MTKKSKGRSFYIPTAWECRGQSRTLVLTCNGSEKVWILILHTQYNNECPLSLRSPSFLWKGARRFALLSRFYASCCSFLIPLRGGCVSYGSAMSEGHTCIPLYRFINSVASDVSDFKSTSIDLETPILRATTRRRIHSKIITIILEHCLCAGHSAEYSIILSDYCNNSTKWGIILSPFFR